MAQNTQRYLRRHVDTGFIECARMLAPDDAEDRNQYLRSTGSRYRWIPDTLDDNGLKSFHEGAH